MPKIRYVPKKFQKKTLMMIAKALTILDEYRAMELGVTLRQLYYQFVSRDWIENTKESYSNLGQIINNARLAGLIDWNDLTDRTRNLQDLEHFEGPQDALDKLAGWYCIDMWKNQSFRPEVWIEKDALLGVIEGVCQKNDTPFMSCRGYMGQSEMWSAGRRMKAWCEITGQTPYVIHLGDHDPSGIDMSRDIEARLTMFAEQPVRIKRIALNMDQVELYKPPPNFAKITDSRAPDYIAKYGNESWELDALDPPSMIKLVQNALDEVRDESLWETDLEEQSLVKNRLCDLASTWKETDQ